MFYELDIMDPMGNTIYKRNDEPSPPGTFQGDLDLYAQIALILDPTATFRAYDGSAPVAANIKVAEDVAALQGFLPRLLPDGYSFQNHLQGKHC
jgi:hypothetical protein